MRSKTIILPFLLIVFLASCDFLKKPQEEDAVARVNDTYLYKSDIENLITETTSKADSTLRVNNYINNWATQQLLMDGARLNLSQDKQEEFNDLIEQYKNDLFIKAYLEALVARSIDTTVSQQEAKDVYQRNQETFKLNEELIKFRYININENIANLSDIEKRFKRFNDEDKKVLDSIAIQFKSYSLNDSIWIRANQAILKIPAINAENKKELLKKSNFIQLKDSLGLYLMHTNNVLLRNENAPIEFVMPTIKQIVINKRKLEFIKELEKDITKDAIKNKQFEIFN
ncbi:peptidyl-prolyl cis-trans isomerase [Pontimicrobium aquaticum]|uniref:Peptidyl-prolyl cis-trans isomerase n=1 Tax=Pontimicrobium aquaticum TaxID=2565367 RepID=A0A4V5LPP2_9FLAO|nr:peptidyl-prolyl cis-trans isomerase [Pontimicrobium aquaticum]TJY32189.1 peptidyl-prolyl cis-trans isomerase [Pontimicrobium aquaticum]